MSAAVKPKRDDDRREAILDRAEELFTEHGFHGVSLATIAQAVGLGNAGLLHHFATKQTLYREVLRRLAAELDSVVGEAIAAAPTIRGKLETLVHAVAAWSQQRAGRARLMIRELLDNVDRVERARTLPLAAFVDACVSLVEAGQMAGTVRHADPLVVLAQVFGALAYAQLARPTFARIAAGKVSGPRGKSPVADERRWMSAVVVDVERMLFAGV